MLSNPLAWLASTFFLLPGIALAIPLHELGHAFVATRFGDRTPINRGYFRPDDPAKYFTLYGLLMMIFWRTGWGARIPVNEYRLEGAWRKVAYHLGGPAANLVLAVVAGLVLRRTGLYFDPISLAQPAAISYLDYLVYGVYFANLSVMAFNLLPVPGFDGWRIVEEVFRRRNPRFFFDVSGRMLQIQQFLILGLFVSQFVPVLGAGLLGLLMLPFYAPAATLILGQCTGYLGLVPCLPSGG